MGKSRIAALCIGIVSLMNISLSYAGVITLFTDRSSFNTTVESTTLEGSTDSAHFPVPDGNLRFSSGFSGSSVANSSGNGNFDLAIDNHLFGGSASGSTPVREPATMLLLGSILVCLAGILKRKKKVSQPIQTIKAGLEKAPPWFAGIRDSFREFLAQ